MKIVKALLSTMKKKDVVSQERFVYNQTRQTIEELCNKYLMNTEDILRFEALPSTIDDTVAILESDYFKERYEFSQVSETLFDVRLRELNIL